MNKSRVYVGEGIYKESLIRLFRDKGIKTSPYKYDVKIYHRKDHQGIIVKGEKDKVYGLLNVLKSALFDSITREHKSREELKKLGDSTLHSLDELKDKFEVKEYVTVEVEFPFNSKVTLTNINPNEKSRLSDYHRFIFTPEELNFIKKYEGYVSDEILKNLMEELIYDRYKPNDTITIYNVRLSGKVHVHPANVISSNHEGLKLKVKENEAKVKYGSWVSEYFKNGEIIYSINTPTEFFKDNLRHWDLEVDVIESPDGNMRVINKEKLHERVKKGIITSKLGNIALRKAFEITKKN
ncbi:MAG: DUF402 domain-containing protein [Candidatus Aenigmarchaeota archaeon]|nr:DUF402 domain-containing protein [Candidatus Aenigmarchaeota archaeon]